MDRWFCPDIQPQPPATRAQAIDALQRAMPSRSHSRGSVTHGAWQPREVCTETVDQRVTALRKLLLSETEKTKIRFRTSLEMRCLELEENRAQKHFILRGFPRDVLQIQLDRRSKLTVGTILTDEPWRRRKLLFIDHSVDEISRRLCVHTVHPTRLKRMLQLCSRATRSIPSHRRVEHPGLRVLKSPM